MRSGKAHDTSCAFPQSDEKDVYMSTVEPPPSLLYMAESGPVFTFALLTLNASFAAPLPISYIASTVRSTVGVCPIGFGGHGSTVPFRCYPMYPMRLSGPVLYL